MPRYSLRNRAPRAAAAVMAAALGVGSLLTSGGTAHADPRQFTSALVAVGSDTIQEVDGAFGGENNNTDYTPLSTDVASGRYQIANWSATGGACITPTAPGATFVRPNGSGAGRKTLSRAIDGNPWGTSGDACGGPKTVTGLVQVARSSSVGTTSGTALTYIPFARDGISYAGYAVGGATAVTSLTRAQLTSIYSAANGNGTVIGSTRVVPCGIQTGSGTYAFWNTVTNGTDEATSTSVCNSVGTGTRLEEHDSAGLVAKGNAINGNATACPSGCMVIVGHSASTWIAQQNGVAPSHIGTGAFIGSISDNGSGTNLGSPVSGSAPNMTPSSTYYADSVFGRDVYHVLNSIKVGGLPSANQNYKQMFVGSSSQVCSAAAQTTAHKYGLASLPGTAPDICGDTTVTRGLDSGAS